ncbi:GM22738 [Drosophila sechellia]|uniref:GM22738 n=2 Tax=Drosophila sechellia TaxID=7238 RepID=B4I763_DROSE|nr:GM22738 [Drosophila sechellia]
MPCLGGVRESSNEDIRHREPVMLNIYDLSTSNDYTFPLGVGVFHSGVQMYGREYAFLAINLSIHPRNGQEELGEHFRFRKSILLGYTNFTCAEVKRVI